MKAKLCILVIIALAALMIFSACTSSDKPSKASTDNKSTTATVSTSEKTEITTGDGANSTTDAVNTTVIDATTASPAITTVPITIDGKTPAQYIMDAKEKTALEKTYLLRGGRSEREYFDGVESSLDEYNYIFVSDGDKFEYSESVNGSEISYKYINGELFYDFESIKYIRYCDDYATARSLAAYVGKDELDEEFYNELDDISVITDDGMVTVYAYATKKSYGLLTILKSFSYEAVINGEGLLVSEMLEISTQNSGVDNYVTLLKGYEKQSEGCVAEPSEGERKDYYRLSVRDDAVKKLLVIGDSISAGTGLPGYIFGLDNSSVNSFANIIAREYGLSDSLVYNNIAVPGYTSADVLACVKNNLELVGDADTVLISVGGNDIIMKLISFVGSTLGYEINELNDAVYMFTDISKKSEAERNMLFARLTSKTEEIKSLYEEIIGGFTNNLLAIVRVIKENNPDAKIVIQTIYNPMDAPNDGFIGEFDPLNEFLVDNFIIGANTVIKTQGDVFGYKVADVFSVFEDNADKYTNITSGDIHPNEIGHIIIASLIMEELLK